MYAWTNQEIEQILMELDERYFPFAKYQFSQLGNGLTLLGVGGFAKVYEATRREKHHGKYAIKVIGFGDKHVDSQFFQKSVQAQRYLGQVYDCVIKVHGFEELYVWFDEWNHIKKVERAVQEKEESIEGSYLKLQFICMEYQEVVQSHKNGILDVLATYNEREVLKVGMMIGEALLRTHKHKILHRDIKLENIFYEPKRKRYKLGDYGVAKVTNDGSASTATFTRGYAAPEVIGRLDDAYDETADIYSFGMMLYVLMNEMKFPASDSGAVNLKEQYEQGYCLPPPQNGSEELFRIVRKMCRYSPDDRYQSMEEVVNELDSLYYYEGLGYERTHRNASKVLGISCLVAGITLRNMPMFLQEFLGISNQLQEYKWLGIALFSLSFFLLLHYGVLQKREHELTTVYFSKGYYWGIVCALYVGTIFVVYQHHTYERVAELYTKLYGWHIVTNFLTWDVGKACVVGAIFSLIWMVRGMVLQRISSESF